MCFREATGVLLLMLLAASAPKVATAQGGEWPTLTGAGLEYLSRSGFFQVSLSGRLDMEAIDVEDSWAGLVGHEGGEDPDAVPDDRLRCLECHVGAAIPGEGGAFATHRLRLFADIFLGDHVYSLVEVRSDRGQAPSDGEVVTRVQQAYLRLSGKRGSIGLQLGKFASPFGGYAPRHLTVVDPFLRPPLAYDYRTVMNRELVPPSALDVLEWKDRPDFFRKPGAPAVWDVPYQWGAMLFGVLGPVDLRFAAVNSAPSSDPRAWAFDRERLEHPSYVLGARVKPLASLDLGVSYSRGPWMEGIIIENAPANSVPPSFWDFDQEMVSADFTVARGAFMLRAEAIIDRWEVPNVTGRATERSYSVELQRDLIAGLSVAVRAGHIDFRPLDDGTGSPTDDWDYDVSRFEASVAYRLVRNAGVLLSAYRQIQKEQTDGDTRLVGLRLWWAF